MPYDRVRTRDWMLPMLRQRLADKSAAELGAVCEKCGLPFAPISRPEDFLDDPHLTATGGLAPIQLPDGRNTLAPLMPLTLQGQRLGVRHNPPKLGEHSRELLASLGYDATQIAHLQQCGAVRVA